MTTKRLTYIFVGMTFAYIGVEYLVERHNAFIEWRASFLAPFAKHPGRREFLHDTLIREEFNVRNT